jgi:LmbE family N-acetylglucosaminyl deacetylase
MKSKTRKSIAVIVAHPDDETLWAGGIILEHLLNDWFIVCLCRASDRDRSARFKNALVLLKAKGVMGDLDDGPNQHPLDEKELEDEILRLLPDTHFDLIMTHDSAGEYTKHLRHEEVNKAVVTLWHNEKITANELWTFAYEDGNKAYLPKAIESADIFESLSEKIWLSKYKLITRTYGFEEDSWEAETTPSSEAFWRFKDPHSDKSK